MIDSEMEEARKKWEDILNPGLREEKEKKALAMEEARDELRLMRDKIDRIFRTGKPSRIL